LKDSQSYLIGINCALLVASNAAGAKLIALPFGMAASAAVVSYILSVLVTDLINELHGRENANLSVKIGFLSVVISSLLFTFAIYLPPADGWTGQNSFEQIFSVAPRILIGGWLAYLVSQPLDVFIFHKIRKATGERHFWLRKNASTLISQLVDSAIFMTIAFYGNFPLLPAILGQFLVKSVLVILETPFSYLILNSLRMKGQR